jgi:hypothetical protein
MAMTPADIKLLDEFATAAITGLLARPFDTYEIEHRRYTRASQDAFACAKEMLAVRAQVIAQVADTPDPWLEPWLEKESEP